MASKCALITGITGQDGSYLAEWLLGQGYRVHGIVRRVALEDPDHRLSRLKEIRGRLVLHAASLESYASIHRVVHEVQPDECYHLAAQSFVSYSFDDEFSTLNANINGTHFLLAAVKTLVPQCRFYFAGSSEMFGQAETVPQNEKRLARVLRRRLRILGGRPAAARLLLSAWRMSQALRMRWLRTPRRQASHSASGVTPVRRHQPRAMLVVAGSLMVEKVRSALVRRA